MIEINGRKYVVNTDGTLTPYKTWLEEKKNS